MKKSILKRLFTAAIFLPSVVTVNLCFAAVPAPPVNQQMGVPDHAFTTMSEPVCRACHNQNPPPGIPIDPTFLPDRHHLKVDTPIPAKTDIPIPDRDGDGVADTTYSCANCHEVTFDPVQQTYKLSELNDCMQCHVYSMEGSVHHRSDKTLTLDCKACHGLINNHPTLGSNPDGHRIPTYDPSPLTPWPSGKPNGDTSVPPSSAGTYPGNCDYCHNTEDGTQGGGAPVQTPIGMLTIDRNEETHHTAAIGSLEFPDQPPCMLCHDFFNPQPEYRIRTCENCHGVDTLHGIAADTNGDGFQYLREDPGYSHVGAMGDCWGCHGFNASNMADKLSVNRLPSIDYLSGSNLSTGSDAIVTIAGGSFTSQEKNPWTGEDDMLVESVVQLIDGEGNKTQLAPISMTDSNIRVVVPGSMAPGNYRVVVDRKGSESNPMNLIIKPEVVIESAVCKGKNLFVTGSGFGGYSKADNAGTSVSVAGEAGRVISWHDGKIHAQATGCDAGAAVSVSGIHGSATGTVE